MKKTVEFFWNKGLLIVVAILIASGLVTAVIHAFYN